MCRLFYNVVSCALCIFVHLCLAFQKLINLKLTIIFYESQEKGYQNPNELKKAKKEGSGRIYPITLLQRGPKT